jgi:hypothetical protein
MAASAGTRAPALIHSGGMTARARQSRLSVPDLEAILAVTGKLAAPFDLMPIGASW